MNALLSLLTAIIPVSAIWIPPEAYISFIIGFGLLAVSNYTLTIDKKECAILRLALAPLNIYFFWDLAYGPHIFPASQVRTGIAVVASYGILRVLETSAVGLLDDRPPYWIINGKEAAIPDTIKGRLMYSLDLTFTLRGNSWFSGRHWNWASKSVVDFPDNDLTRGEYLRRTGISLSKQYVVFDAFDALNKSRVWDPMLADPITRLPFHEQLLFSLSVCATTAMSITIIYSIVSMIFVALGSSPSCWAPMFDRPFSATSLSDFWTRRWHAIFRRVLERISFAILHFLPIPKSPASIYKHARATLIFALSASMHIMVMYRIDNLEIEHPVTVLYPAILKFFLSQPIGLAIEALVLIPTLRAFVPQEWHLIIIRTWAWCFMLWSGRYWSDIWIHRGLWQPVNKVVGFSIVRGLLWGRWFV